MYEKINWNGTIMLTPDRLRHMETQYEEAAAYIDQNLRQTNNKELRAEVVGVEPEGEEGRFYFDLAEGKMFGYGAGWEAWE